MQAFEFQRAVAALREWRNLVLAFIVALVIAVGTWLAFFRQSNSPVAESVGEESCSTTNGAVGYARAIVLCTAGSPRCRPDQERKFRAQPPGGWNTEAMLIPDIPEGYVITGGDLIDPAVYQIRSRGFDGVRVTNYTNSNDYCTLHYWYYLHANWVSPDAADRVTVTLCIYYDRWRGAPPTEACALPTGGVSP